MGLVHTKLMLANPRRDDLAPMEVTALVDTGSVHLCIPHHVALQLGIETLEQREVFLADGRKALVPYAGPLKTTFSNRSCYTGAMIMGDEVLLGAIPMEDMDLVVHPSSQQVMPNPLNPNIPGSMAKGFTTSHTDQTKNFSEQS